MADLLGSLGGMVTALPGVGLVKDLVEGKDAGEIGSNFLDNSKKTAKNPLVQGVTSMVCPGAGGALMTASMVGNAVSL